jgi:large subunit ribosomal protein L21
MYAVVHTGGKQYRVAPDEMVQVEKLPAAKGEVVELDRVAMIEQDGKVQIGSPWLAGAKVVCKVVSHGRDRKIDIFNYRSKGGFHRAKGHRQPYTQLKVEQIVAGG